jgi:lysine-specific demethylase 8
MPMQDSGRPVPETVADYPDYFAGADLVRSLKRKGLDVRRLPEADEPTPEALQEAVARHDGPLVFHGLATDWPACSRWSPTELRRSHADRQVTALVDLPGSGVLFPQDQRLYERTLPFAEFVDAMLSATAESPCYLAYKRVQEIFPCEDYDFASLLGPYNTDPDTRVWVGSAGTRSMLHSDLKDNLFCQIWGEKHIVLVPWEDSISVYPFPDNLVNSQVDLAELDLERFPKLRDAVLYAGTVGPGDILFMPRGWWHDIRSKTPSVSVNHWFGPPLEFRDYLPLLAKLGPACWWATARDFVRSGLLGKEEETKFFFTPASTGKRLFDLVRFGDFSRDNDPAKGEGT